MHPQQHELKQSFQRSTNPLNLQIKRRGQTTELQSEKVQICASLGIEMVSSGILRFSLAKRSCLPSLQPIRIRAANAFAALAFLVWPARRRVLQRAVCHLAAHIDNNAIENANWPITREGHFYSSLINILGCYCTCRCTQITIIQKLKLFHMVKNQSIIQWLAR